MFVPIRDATIIARAKPATIRQWARAGKVATEMADDGEPLYEIAGLVEMEAQTREANLRHNYARLARSLTLGA